METIKTRFDQRIITGIIAVLLVSFVLSFFLFQILCIMLFFLWLFDINKSKRLAFDRFVQIVILFGVIRAVSIFLSEFPDISYASFLRESLFYTTMISLNFYLKAVDKKKFNFLHDFFINAGVVVSIIGIIQFAAGYVHRAQGLTSGYSTFSAYLLVVFIFMINHRKNKTEFDKWYWAAKLGIILAGLITSLGRTNIIVALLAGIVSLFLRREKLKYFSATVLTAGLISIIAFSFNSSEVQNRIDQPATLSDRDILWKGFGELAPAHPFFGYGPRTFRNIFPYLDDLADKEVGSWHNEYFQIYIESGIFALLVMLGFYSFVFWDSLKKRAKLSEDGIAKDITYSIIILIPSILLASVTDGFFVSIIMSVVIITAVNFYAASGMKN